MGLYDKIFYKKDVDKLIYFKVYILDYLEQQFSSEMMNFSFMFRSSEDFGFFYRVLYLVVMIQILR